jgi:hypothetical protein
MTERKTQPALVHPKPWLAATATSVIAVLLALSTNVAASLVPSQWTQRHQWVIWAIIATLVVVTVVTAAKRRETASWQVVDHRNHAEAINGPIVIVNAGSSVMLDDESIGTRPVAPPVGGAAHGSRPGRPLLPSRPPFLNRDREMCELLARIRAGEDSLLTIEGERWVGKSAATAALVRTLLETPAEGAFDPDRRHFVWLDANDACPSVAEICGELALETGEYALTAAPGAAKSRALRAHLARSGTVLVLDNLRLGDDERSRVMIDLLDDLPHGALVIASINRPGALVAPRVKLDDLDAETVHELIIDHVYRLGVDGPGQFDEAFSARLQAAIGGNPGVIEWFLRGYRDSSDTLERRITAVENGVELSKLFEPTWQALEHDHQEVLEACAYLGGRATVRQMSTACGRSAAHLSPAAEELRREGVLTPVRSRDRPTVFTCAKAFQVFVAAKTSTSRRRTFTERLADHYVDYFREHPEDAAYGETEVDALGVVRVYLFQYEDDRRMQALFRVVLDILFTIGQFDELIDASDLAYKSADRVENFAGAALGALIQACTHAIRGEHASALAAYTQGRLAAESSGLPDRIARAKRCGAFLNYRARQPRQALAEIEGVEELARCGDDLSTVVDAFDLSTAANWYMRRLDACEAAAHGSLQAGAAIPWQRARAFPLRYLAEIAIQRREWRNARALLEEAGDIATRFGDQRQLARIDLTRARCGLLYGPLEAAQSAARRAVTQTTKLGLPPEQEEALALATAIDRAQRSTFWRRYYRLRRPTRLSGAPVGGD